VFQYGAIINGVSALGRWFFRRARTDNSVLAAFQTNGGWENISIKGGAIMDHMPPVEWRLVAVEK
jgi:hypothetical protein